MSVPNQEIVKMAKRKPFDKENIYSRMHIDAMQEAMKKLKGESFKLWCYLNKNQESHTLELSQKALEEWGIKKDAYYAAKKKLKQLGYLVQSKEGSNIFIFHEILSEKPKEDNNHSEKPKEFSEKPNTLSEKPKNLSEIPQRNITDITDITDKGDCPDKSGQSAKPVGEITLKQLTSMGCRYEAIGENLIKIIDTQKVFKLKEQEKKHNEQ